MLENGTVLKTFSGKTITVIGAAEGEAKAYKAKPAGNDEELILHWLDGKDAEETYNFVSKLSTVGNVDKRFLWPLETTVLGDGGYGYLTKSAPAGYVPLGAILKNKAAFKNDEARISFCINLTHAFRRLFNSGFFYNTLSVDGFLADVTTGNVLIKTVPYLAAKGMARRCKEDPAYSAPEVYYGTALPSARANLHGMAILLFEVLFGGHPFEGVKSFVPFITEQKKKELYGENAEFVFSPDTANKPVNSIHGNMIKRWNNAPLYIRQLFIDTLSAEAVKNPEKRLVNSSILKELLRYESSLVRCDCGEVYSVNGMDEDLCPRCGKKGGASAFLQLDSYIVPLTSGKRIYKMMLDEEIDSASALDVVFGTLSKKGNTAILGLKNNTDEDILLSTTGGRIVLPAKCLSPLDGINALTVNGKNYDIIRKA